MPADAESIGAPSLLDGAAPSAEARTSSDSEVAWSMIARRSFHGKASPATGGRRSSWQLLAASSASAILRARRNSERRSKSKLEAAMKRDGDTATKACRGKCESVPYATTA